MVRDNLYRAIHNQVASVQQQPQPQAILISDTESEADGQPPNAILRGRCRRRRPPRHARPQSLIDSRSEKTKKSYRFARRVANSREIAAMFPIDEELTVDDICPDYNGLFGDLMANNSASEAWWSFSGKPEAEQNVVLAGARSNSKIAAATKDRSCFLRTSRKFRDAVRLNLQFAMPIVADIEDLVRIAIASNSVLVLRPESSFHRLLAHGVAEYLAVESSSVDAHGERLVLLSCKGIGRNFPDKHLVDYMT